MFDQPHAFPAQGGNGIAGTVLDRIGDCHQPGESAVDSNEHHALAFAAAGIGSAIERGRG